MELLKKMLLLGLSFVLATKIRLISTKGGHCSSRDKMLSHSDLSAKECQQRIGCLRQNWHRMICHNETNTTSIDRGCCESWCKQLAFCFKQSPDWTSRCKKMWKCSKGPLKRLSIIVTNRTDASYMGSIEVKRCWARNFPAIKLTSVIQSTSKKLVDTILKEVKKSSGNRMNKEKMQERVFLSVTDLEELIGNYSQHYLKSAARKIYIPGEHADIFVRKIFDENERDLQFGDDKEENFLSLPTAGLDIGWRVTYLSFS